MELPLFPLHLVLFPGARLPLHIFESRYIELMEHVLDTDRRFGVVAIRRGSDTGPGAETFSVGTVAEVEQVQRTANGTMDVLVAGRARFSLDVRLPDDPYPRGQVTLLADEPGADATLMLKDARAAIHRYVGAVARLQRSDEVVPNIPSDLHEASFVLAAVLQVDIRDRQRLLEAPDAAARLRMVTELAHREALLLQRVGPPVVTPNQRVSPN